jgi:hypothetical protein
VDPNDPSTEPAAESTELQQPTEELPETEPEEPPESEEEPQEPEPEPPPDPEARSRRRRNIIAIAAFAVTIIGVGLVLYFTVFSASSFVDHQRPSAGEAESSASETMPLTPVEIGPPPDAPLPVAEELTDVLYKLADPNIPGDQKLDLVEGATDANAINAFAKALQDSGIAPIDVIVQNIAWASSPRGHVTADVTISGPNTAGLPAFPMEFTPRSQGGWQLSRTTAGILLTYGQNPATPTSPPPSPTPTG